MVGVEVGQVTLKKAEASDCDVENVSGTKNNVIFLLLVVLVLNDFNGKLVNLNFKLGLIHGSSNVVHCYAVVCE